jgi:hypothetical protein
MEQPATNRRGRAPPSNLRPTSVSKQIILRPTRGPPPFLFLPPFLFTCISPLSLTHKHRRHIISLARPHRQQFVPPTDVCYNSLHFTAAPMKQQLPLIERHTFDNAFNSISLKTGKIQYITLVKRPHENQITSLNSQLKFPGTHTPS